MVKKGDGNGKGERREKKSMFNNKERGCKEEKRSMRKRGGTRMLCHLPLAKTNVMRILVMDIE